MSSELKFDSSFVRSLPGLDETGPVRPRQTPGVLYSRVTPTPVAAPKIVLWSDEVAQMLGLTDSRALADNSALREQMAAVYSGNDLMPGMVPFATRYGGHQFGNWAGQLGDGRAISLGEVLTREHGRQEIQLKGAGQTPYSRFADGRTVLRSSLREFVCSEAMHGLGIPTTRALSLTLTGDKVVRDMFYDGRPEEEPGAVTTRVAPSFLRFGHFQILAAHGEVELLKRLVRYSVTMHRPEFAFAEDTWDEDKVCAWFDDICMRTAAMVCGWQRVGFVHGVMNTDNMSILGLTIDYGPFGFLDNFDPTWTPNTTDFESRRYRYEQQPAIGQWNLVRFGEALAASITNHNQIINSLSKYVTEYQALEHSMKLAKIGLTAQGDPSDAEFLKDLGVLLTSTEVDMTVFYRNFPRFIGEESEDQTQRVVREAVYAEEVDPAWFRQLGEWLRRYQVRFRAEGVSSSVARERMNLANPVVIPRNFILQEVLDEFAGGEGRRTKIDDLLEAIKRPYDDTELTRKFFRKRPDWARSRPGCSALSCSS